MPALHAIHGLSAHPDHARTNTISPHKPGSAVFCQGVDAGYRQRLRGFEETVAKVGFPIRRMIYHDYFHKEVRHAPKLGWTEYVLQSISDADKPLAVFALDDEIGGSVLRHCDDAGWRIPEEVAVLGVGNEHLICDYTPAPLSSIDMNLEQLGWKAAELLHALMDGHAPPDKPVVIPPLGVVERRSTEILSADDPRAMRALRYLQEHLQAPLRSASVARAVGLSRSCLDRIFAKAFGRTIKKELMRLRMQRIRELLATSNIPAKEIAILVGFRTLAHMSRAFQQENKVTLRQFRARLSVSDMAPWETPPHAGRLVRRTARQEGPRKREQTGVG